MNFKFTLHLGFLFLLLPVYAVAQEGLDPYNIANGCVSLGSWTQSALDGSRAVMYALEKMQSNAKCKGMRERIKAMVTQVSAANAALATSNADVRAVNDETERRKGEILALQAGAVIDPQTGAPQDPFSQTDLAMRLVQSQIEEATADGKRAFNESTHKTRTSNEQINAALGAFDAIVSGLPLMNECLMGADRDATGLVTGLISTAAGVAASGGGDSRRISSSVTNFLNTLRELQFTRAKLRLYQNQFQTSLTCLLETTTQNYCNAKDALDILNYTADLRAKHVDKIHTLATDEFTPLQGYRILTRDAPLVQKWIIEAMFGVPPPFQRDADFRIGTFATWVSQLNKVWALQGYINEQLFNIQSNKALTVDEKRAIVLKILREAVFRLQSDRDANENFFEMTIPRQLFPFYLIGRSSIPPEVAMSQVGRQQSSWDDYMMNFGHIGNTGWVEEFSDPIALIGTIQRQLERLSELAKEKANTYVMTRLVLDMPLGAAKALIDPRLTVLKALKNIYKYLDQLKAQIQHQRLSDDSRIDPLVIPNIIDTQVRVRHVIEAFDKIRPYTTPESEERMQTDEAYRLLIKEDYENVLKVTFDQFNVLLQRDMFLTARLAEYVRADFSLRVRTREDMSPIVQQILLAAGDELQAKIGSYLGKNPDAVHKDLLYAMSLNRNNIQVMEGLFSDVMIPMIQEYKLRSENKRPTDWDLVLATEKRLEEDSYRDALRPEADHGFDTTPVGRLWSLFAAGAGIRQIDRMIRYPDRYPLSIPNVVSAMFGNGPPRGGRDPYGSDDLVLGRLCIQSLAFENRAKFVPLCTKSAIKSYYTLRERNLEHDFLSAHYNCYLGHPHVFSKSGQQRMECHPEPEVYMAPTTPDNYCALRDYNRRNLIYFLTRDLYEDPS